MINHVRTLLLNVSGSVSPGPGYPGEEFVPPTYVSVQLPPNLQVVWSAIFGPNPDRAMLNLRLREIMAIIHSTELAAYATAVDPRLTYWPPHNQDLFRALTFGANAQQLSGAATPLYFNNAGTFASIGQLYWQLNVSVISSTQVDVTQLTNPQTTVTDNYTITSGLSNAIQLANSGLTIQFGQPGSPLPTWLVTALAEPLYTMADVLPALDAVDTAPLFTAGAPFEGLAALWEIQTLPAIYRIGAAALALAYQINNLVTPPG